MSQQKPVIDNVVGADYRAQSNQARQALMTNHKGNTVPPYAESGMTWCDDTDSPWLVKFYDGADWITILAIDPVTNHSVPYANGEMINVPAPYTTDHEQTDATYIFALSDCENNTIIRGNHVSGQTFTVPNNADTAFPMGAILAVEQYGAGQITIEAGSGVTIRTAETFKLRGQYSSAALRKIGINEWLLIGDLEAA